MISRIAKGGGAFEGIKLPLCENPLPPVEEAMYPPTMAVAWEKCLYHEL